MHEAATAIAGLSVSSGNTSKNDSLAPCGMPYVASGTGDGMVGWHGGSWWQTQLALSGKADNNYG